jgi:hypothetical protein
LPAGEAFDGLGDAVELAEVQTRLDAAGVEVVGQRDDVHVPRPLAVPEQRALDAVAPGLEGQLGGGHRHALVVVRVQRDQHAVARGKAAAEPLDHVGVVVRRAALHGGREVQDHGLVGRGLAPRLKGDLADLQRELQVGVGELLRRVLEADVAARRGVGQRADLLDGASHHVDRLLVRQVEHLAHVQLGRRAVGVEDAPRRAAQGLERPVDQVPAALSEAHDEHVVGHVAFLDQPAGEVEVVLARRGERHLDVLKADVAQELEVLQLPVRREGIGQGLVAVSQIDRAPDGAFLDRSVGPLPVRQIDRPGGEVLGGAGGRHGLLLSCWYGTRYFDDSLRVG